MADQVRRPLIPERPSRLRIEGQACCEFSNELQQSALLHAMSPIKTPPFGCMLFGRKFGAGNISKEKSHSHGIFDWDSKLATSWMDQ